jgi:hypothetical protein
LCFNEGQTLEAVLGQSLAALLSLTAFGAAALAAFLRDAREDASEVAVTGGTPESTSSRA